MVRRGSDMGSGVGPTLGPSPTVLCAGIASDASVEV